MEFDHEMKGLPTRDYSGNTTSVWPSLHQPEIIIPPQRFPLGVSSVCKDEVHSFDPLLALKLIFIRLAGEIRGPIAVAINCSRRTCKLK